MQFKFERPFVEYRDKSDAELRKLDVRIIKMDLELFNTFERFIIT